MTLSASSDDSNAGASAAADVPKETQRKAQATQASTGRGGAVRIAHIDRLEQAIDRAPASFALGDWLKIATIALLSGLLLIISVGNTLLTFGFTIGLLLSLVGLLLVHYNPDLSLPKQDKAVDWAILSQIIEQDDTAIAITDRNGRLVCANDEFVACFGGFATPPHLPLDKRGLQRLLSAGQAAWRDGASRTTISSTNPPSVDTPSAEPSVASDSSVTSDSSASDSSKSTSLPTSVASVSNRHYQVEIARSGYNDAYLVWRFAAEKDADIVNEIIGYIDGAVGAALSSAGIMVAMVDSDGRLRATNDAFLVRATGYVDTSLADINVAKMLRFNDVGDLYFSHEGESASPVRLLQIPLVAHDSTQPIVIVLLDEERSSLDRTSIQDPSELLFSRLPFGVGVVDRDGRFLHVNRAFCRAAGVSEDKPPRYPGDVVVSEDKGALADAVYRGSIRQQLNNEISVRLASQPDEPVSMQIIGVRGIGDARVLISLRDSSELLKLKRQVAQATKMQAVGQLAGGVAHDFNNILTGVISMCDLMLGRHVPGDGDYDDLQQIRSHTNRASNLTRQLLAFSRRQTLVPQILQIPDVISEVSHLLKRLLGENIELSVRHGRGLGAVRADPGQLEQVIVNLAVNARDAMPDGGALTIETFSVLPHQVAGVIGGDIMPAVKYSALRVSDTGSGIPEDIISKIYEPFFTTKAMGEGTGLGLSTVYGIIKQSSGFIFHETEEGKGTSFYVYLPACSDVAAEAAASASLRPKKQDIKDWGSGTILLVEDEFIVREVAERTLSQIGYVVLAATQGEEGLQYFQDKANDIDLVISDVIMPAMDGPTMVTKIRAIRSDIPILFMSGYAEGELREASDIPNVHFLPKPFSVGELTDAVAKALAVRRGRDSAST